LLDPPSIAQRRRARLRRHDGLPSAAVLPCTAVSLREATWLRSAASLREAESSHWSELHARRRWILVALAIFLGFTSPQLSLSAWGEPAQLGSDSDETSPNPSNKRDKELVVAWFQKYDAIRSDAEMMADEKALSKQLLRRAMLPLASGKEKEDARELAAKMVERYSTALARMRQLQATPETSELQAGYIRYFTDSKELFEELGHKFSKDKEERRLAKHLLSGLMSGRKELALVDESNKKLDGRLRAEYGIPEHKSKSGD
jgi:hypothetical protein